MKGLGIMLWLSHLLLTMLHDIFVLVLSNGSVTRPRELVWKEESALSHMQRGMVVITVVGLSSITC